MTIERVSNEHKSDRVVRHSLKISQRLKQVPRDHWLHSLHIDAFIIMNTLQCVHQMILDQRNLRHGNTAEHEVNNWFGIFRQRVRNVTWIRIVDLDEFFLYRTNGIVGKIFHQEWNSCKVVDFVDWRGTAPPYVHETVVLVIAGIVNVAINALGQRRYRWLPWTRKWSSASLSQLQIS